MQRLTLPVLLLSAASFAPFPGAETSRVYAGLRYVQGAGDTLGHWLALYFDDAGRPVRAEFRLYEGPPEPTLRAGLSVRVQSASIVCGGKHPERGQIRLRGTLSPAAIRGELHIADLAPERVRLLRRKEEEAKTIPLIRDLGLLP